MLDVGKKSMRRLCCRRRNRRYRGSGLFDGTGHTFLELKTAPAFAPSITVSTTASRSLSGPLQGLEKKSGISSPGSGGGADIGFDQTPGGALADGFAAESGQVGIGDVGEDKEGFAALPAIDKEFCGTRNGRGGAVGKASRGQAVERRRGADPVTRAAG